MKGMPLWLSLVLIVGGIALIVAKLWLAFREKPVSARGPRRVGDRLGSFLDVLQGLLLVAFLTLVILGSSILSDHPGIVLSLLLGVSLLSFGVFLWRQGRRSPA